MVKITFPFDPETLLIKRWGNDPAWMHWNLLRPRRSLPHLLMRRVSGSNGNVILTIGFRIFSFG
jgi:hypothetical protein